METVELHFQRLSTFAVCLLLCLASICKPQEFTIQISPDSTVLNQFPSIHLDDSGRVWVAYVSNDSALVAGYYFQNSWHTELSLDPQGGIIPGSFVEATVDEAQRVWFTYMDSTGITRVAYFDSMTWTLIATSLPVLGITRNYPNGVWFSCKGGSYLRDTVFAYQAVGSSVLRSKTISVPPEDPEYMTSTIVRQHIAVLRHDSVVSFYKFVTETWAMNHYWCDYSIFRFSESSPLAIVRKDCGRAGPGGNEGSMNFAVAFGTDGNSVLSVTQVTPLYFQNSYVAHFMDSTVLGIWWNFIPAVDNSGLNSDPQISASKNSNMIALVWFYRDSLRVKMFSRPHWYLTRTYDETASDSTRRTPRVVVGQDSSVWVAFTGMKDNHRHVFLSKIRPSFMIDGSLSSVPPEQPDRTPLVFSLSQNFPNPFNPSTIIKFHLARPAFLTIKVFDVLGREVATLVNENMQPGVYERIFHAEHLATGVYLCRLQTDSFVQTRKLLLLR